MELRIGEVVSCEAHPNADRLFVLEVDLGPELGRRQLVAGIRGAYAADEVVGTHIVVVTNLEPATIRGVESQGMLLAAQDDNGICLVTTQRPVTAGTKVS